MVFDHLESKIENVRTVRKKVDELSEKELRACASQYGVSLDLPVAEMRERVFEKILGISSADEYKHEI